MPLRLSMAWGGGAFGQAVAFYAYTVLLFRYLADTAAISAALVGTLIALSKIYDAIIAPLIGFLSDRVPTPMGRRRPWMILGGVLLASSMLVLFNVPLSYGMTGKIAWAAMGLLIFSTGYSFIAIPWLAMPAEMTDDYNRRTNMMSWRVVFSSSGQTAGALGGPVLLSVLGVGAVAYGRMGIVLGSVCLIASMTTIYLLRDARGGVLDMKARPNLKERLRLTLANRPFVVLVALKSFLYFGLAFYTAAMALFSRRVLQVSDLWLGSFFIVTTLSSIAGQIVWLKLSRRFGKRPALCVALTVHALTISTLIFAEAGQPLVYLFIRGVILGAASGGVFMLSQSLLPDVIEYDFRRTGMSRAGSFTGVMSFLETGAGGFGIFALGLLLSGAGYIEGLATATGEQPGSALLAIRLACSIIPACSDVICILIMTRYRLSEAALRAER
jgi:GPH family glycoside/pentoside/hexuronide:cation symporter